jgi:hypothetical protein
MNKNYDNSNIKLPVSGQGVIIFKTTLENCSFIFYNKTESNGIKINFSLNEIKATIISPEKVLIDENNNSGIEKSNGIYYWVSLDSQNQKIQAGIGEARIENIKYKYQFPKESIDIFHKTKAFLESIVKINILDNNIKNISTESTSSIKIINILKDPITLKIPLTIKNIDYLSMLDIATGNFLPKSSLLISAEKLYNCISGKKFILDDDDFPDFSKAIEYSIATPNLWCYEKIKDKSTEFNKDKPNILETYLRITLGQNNGESPGIPYVMEIWPSYHYSPIHNHGGAHAIIRVLYGEINVSLYPYLSNDKNTVKPFANSTFKKDEITWISPTLNQTHKLENLNNSQTCITIQCYMYDNDNNLHYDYFDYLDSDNNIQQYEPDSDMDFIEFKKIIKSEWENRNQKENDKYNKYNKKNIKNEKNKQKSCNCYIS